MNVKVLLAFATFSALTGGAVASAFAEDYEFSAKQMDAPAAVLSSTAAPFAGGGPKAGAGQSAFMESRVSRMRGESTAALENSNVGHVIVGAAFVASAADALVMPPAGVTAGSGFAPIKAAALAARGEPVDPGSRPMETSGARYLSAQ